MALKINFEFRDASGTEIASRNNRVRNNKIHSTSSSSGFWAKALLITTCALAIFRGVNSLTFPVASALTTSPQLPHLDLANLTSQALLPALGQNDDIFNSFNSEIQAPVADPNQDALLYEAIKSMNPEEVEVLLSNGANPNALHGVYPLVFAATEGLVVHRRDAQDKELQIVRLLHKYGADIDYRLYGDGISAFEAIAFSTEYSRMMELLLELGADINHSSLRKETPLTKAIQDHDLPLMKFLVKNGADVNQHLHDSPGLLRTRGAATPLLQAIYSYHKRYVDLAYEGENWLGKPIWDSMKRNAKGIEVTDQDLNNEIEMINFLIESGADLNESKPTSPICLAVELNNPNLIHFLLSKGVDINQNHSAALAKAVEKGNVELVKLLLSLGAAPLLGETFEKTPLSVAENSLYYKQEIVELLYERVGTNKFLRSFEKIDNAFKKGFEELLGKNIVSYQTVKLVGLPFAAIAGLYFKFFRAASSESRPSLSANFSTVTTKKANLVSEARVAVPEANSSMKASGQAKSLASAPVVKNNPEEPKENIVWRFAAFLFSPFKYLIRILSSIWGLFSTRN